MLGSKISTHKFDKNATIFVLIIFVDIILVQNVKSVILTWVLNTIIFEVRLAA